MSLVKQGSDPGFAYIQGRIHPSESFLALGRPFTPRRTWRRDMRAITSLKSSLPRTNSWLRASLIAWTRFLSRQLMPSGWRS